jgi:hypothetical protein
MSVVSSNSSWAVEGTRKPYDKCSRQTIILYIPQGCLCPRSWNLWMCYITCVKERNFSKLTFTKYPKSGSILSIKYTGAPLGVAEQLFLFFFPVR